MCISSSTIAPRAIVIHRCRLSFRYIGMYRLYIERIVVSFAIRRQLCALRCAQQKVQRFVSCAVEYPLLVYWLIFKFGQFVFPAGQLRPEVALPIGKHTAFLDSALRTVDFRQVDDIFAEQRIQFVVIAQLRLAHFDE